VSAMIEDLRKEADIQATNIMLSVPLRYSFIKEIQMPEMPEEEMRTSVPFEARKYIPLPIDEVVVDWKLMSLSERERAVAKKEKHIPILLSAAQKSALQRYSRAVDGAGLTLLGSEVESFSLLRAIIGRFRSPLMVIDIGAASTKIMVAENGGLRAAYGVEQAGQQLTLTLAKAIGVDFSRAERMKHELGIVESPETQELRLAVLPVLDAIFAEADRLREFYRKTNNVNLDKILITGGTSLMPGFIEYATKHFGVEVLRANPFAQIEYPAAVEPIVGRIAPSFGVAVGLALKALKQK